MAIIGTWEKQPFDQITHEFDMSKLYASLVVTGYALNAVAVLVEEEELGTDSTTDMIEGSVSMSGNLAYVTFKGGVTGKRYIARIRSTWTKAGSVNQLKEDEFIIVCLETGRTT